MRPRLPAISRGTSSILTLAFGICTLTAAVIALAAPAASAAHSPRVGWIRLAHFSPNTPAVDVYLYSFGNPRAKIVLKHVSYGAVSPYEKVRSGEYTVAMRGAGASPGSPPVLSTNVRIVPGGAYTVAGMGPAKGLRLEILTDRLTTPDGKSLVRVIQASLRDHRVKVVAGSQVLARSLAFAHVTSYVATAPGTWMVRVSGSGTATSQQVTLVAGTIHTLVVLDSASGLQLTNLEDAAGSAVLPQGGAATGMGGTAPAPGSSPLPWVGVVAAGLLCMGAGAFRLRRVRSAPRHAR
jgi:Domain of unknown function (DUF4397)